MKKNAKKVATAIGLGALLVGAGMGAGAYLFPREVTVEKTVPGPEKIVEVPVDRVIEVETKVEVPVDNGNLKMVLEELVEKDGSVEYLTEDLDDDEVDFIVERLFLTKEWEELAFQKVKDKAGRELDGEEASNISIDEDDISALNIKEDEITFEDIDFDDHDADVLVPFTFRQDEDRFDAVARVTILDGEVESLVIEDLSLRT